MKRINFQIMKPFIKEFLVLIIILALFIPGVLITGLVRVEVRFAPITVSAMIVFGIQCMLCQSRVVSYGVLAMLDLVQQRTEKAAYSIKAIYPYRLSALTKSKGRGADVIYVIVVKDGKETVSLLSGKYPELDIGGRYNVEIAQHTKMIISTEKCMSVSDTD